MTINSKDFLVIHVSLSIRFEKARLNTRRSVMISLNKRNTPMCLHTMDAGAKMADTRLSFNVQV